MYNIPAFDGMVVRKLVPQFHSFGILPFNSKHGISIARQAR